MTRTIHFFKIACGLFLFLVIAAFKQEKEEVIYWAPGTKLTWNDFKGEPNGSSTHVANTNSGISAPWRSSGDSVSVSITCLFDKNKSWVKPGSKTPYILQHEQGHFDITELFARKFRKTVSTYKFNMRSFKETYRKLYEANHLEWAAYQNNYDKETDHSKIPVKQEEWEKKIEQELESLKSFSGENIHLYLPQ